MLLKITFAIGYAHHWPQCRQCTDFTCCGSIPGGFLRNAFQSCRMQVMSFGVCIKMPCELTLSRNISQVFNWRWIWEEGVPRHHMNYVAIEELPGVSIVLLNVQQITGFPWEKVGPWNGRRASNPPYTAFSSWSRCPLCGYATQKLHPCMVPARKRSFQFWIRMHRSWIRVVTLGQPKRGLSFMVLWHQKHVHNSKISLLNTKSTGHFELSGTSLQHAKCTMSLVRRQLRYRNFWEWHFVIGHLKFPPC
jgi:hypothetical protein